MVASVVVRWDRHRCKHYALLEVLKFTLRVIGAGDRRDLAAVDDFCRRGHNLDGVYTAHDVVIASFLIYIVLSI